MLQRTHFLINRCVLVNFFYVRVLVAARRIHYIDAHARLFTVVRREKDFLQFSHTMRTFGRIRSVWIESLNPFCFQYDNRTAFFKLNTGEKHFSLVLKLRFFWGRSHFREFCLLPIKVSLSSQKTCKFDRFAKSFLLNNPF